MGINTLSVCMIVKNEEQYLDSCLSAISNKVDEIILVDTGSSDNTLDIAKKYGVNIFEIEWINDFSYARNISLQHASKDWILVLDADEMIPEEELQKIYHLIQTQDIHAYQLIIRNILPDGEIIAYNEQPALRLFMNHSGFKYQGKIHESIQPSIIEAGYKIKKTDVYLNHYGYAQTVSQGKVPRGDRNLSLLLDSLALNNYDPYIHYQLGITYKHLHDSQSADKHLKNALSFNKNELSPEILSDTFLKLAQIALSENKTKKSIKYAKSSIQHNPQNLVAVYLLSVNLVETKQYKSAIPHLQLLANSELISPEEKEDIRILLHFSLSQV